MFKPLIIIPTLNEVDHIIPVLNSILKQAPLAHILVIDASSEDGTWQMVERLGKRFSTIHYQRQNNSDGYGGAIRQGFEFALQADFDPVMTMDGDGAHDAMYLGRFFELAAKYEVVSGSRYIDGVRVEGWRFRKLILSKLANMYVSYIMVKPVWDFTSGFRCYSRRFLEQLDLGRLHPEAYILQIQMIYMAFKRRFKVKEIPTIFRGTQDAPSKINNQSWFKTFGYVLKFRAPWLEIIRHMAYFKKKYERFVAEYEELVNPPELKNEGRFEVRSFYTISVGVMAYNEEDLIANCLTALSDQKLQSGEIVEIFVVSSGSTDRTNSIVMDMINEDNRIRLITQPSRRGKASAINEFLRVAEGDILVLESADTIPEPYTVEYLVCPFKDQNIGMTGAHPVPVNDKNTIGGFCIRTMWELHHRLALEHPKCGEMVAFRNIISRIPSYTAVDEASLEAIIVEAGLGLAYAPQAIVRNKGPETLGDFIKQRRRIASGHRHLQVTIGHEVSTKRARGIIKHVFKIVRWTPRGVLYMTSLIIVEILARFLGFVDFYLRDHNPFIWDISATTKKM